MAREKLRVTVKRKLKKYGYLPNLQAIAIKTVLQQAQPFSAKWAVWIEDQTTVLKGYFD